MNEHDLFEVSCKIVFTTPDKSKVLIFQYDDGSYGLPGGHIAHGENLTDTACREIKEELGINYTGELTQIGFGYMSFYSKRADIQREKIILGFAGTLDEKTKFTFEPDNPEYTVGITWMPAAEALNPEYWENKDCYPEFIKQAIGEIK